MKKEGWISRIMILGMIMILIFGNTLVLQVEAATPTTTEQIVSDEEEKIRDYFGESVFVGDSIMLGFRNYSIKQKDSFLNQIQFLASGSFSANNALWEVTDKSVHPVYQGKKQQIWESISLMKVKRVFLFLGMNDLNVYGLEGTIAAYQELITKIKEASPHIQPYIMSMTYTLKGAGKGKLQNDTIREFNLLLQSMADEQGWTYIDMATPLADEQGDLVPEYCSDGFVHQSREAYQVWTDLLYAYARAELSDTQGNLPVSAEQREQITQEILAKYQKPEQEEKEQLRKVRFNRFQFPCIN